MKLIRTAFRADGVFGRLYNDNGVPLCYTLEHAFEQDDGSWLPKIAVGTYNCVLGEHQLLGMAHPFQTYMLENVPDFMGKPVTNILIHTGNTDLDSAGCILVGDAIIVQTDGTQMVTNSRVTFQEIITSLNNIPEFPLIIS